MGEWVEDSFHVLRKWLWWIMLFLSHIYVAQAAPENGTRMRSKETSYLNQGNMFHDKEKRWKIFVTAIKEHQW